MTQLEVQKVSVLPDDNVIEKKYRRLGHLNEGKLSDQISICLFDKLPGPVLPKRWKYSSPKEFVEKFGDGFVWAVTSSYHCLFHNGNYILRVWTDSGKENAVVDVSNEVANLLESYFAPIEPIPPGSLHKCRPLTRRFKMTHVEDIVDIVEAVNKWVG